jgi:hypothetical protein
MVISKSVNRFCSRIYLEFIQQISPLCASKTGSLKERSARPFETRPAECAHPLARCAEEKDKIFTLKRAKTAAAYSESASAPHHANSLRLKIRLRPKFNEFVFTGRDKFSLRAGICRKNFCILAILRLNAAKDLY